MTFRCKVFALAMLALAAPGHAAVVEIGMGAFDPGASTFDFDTEALGDAQGRDFGDFTTTMGPGPFNSLIDGLSYGGGSAINRQVIASDELTVTFDFRITQFGFNFGGNLIYDVDLSFFDGATFLNTLTIGNPIGDNWGFEGFEDIAGFDRIVFDRDTNNDGTYGVFDFKYTKAPAVIPLPAGLPLMLAALGVFAAAARHRKT